MQRNTYISKCNDTLALSQFKEKETDLLLNEEKKFREKLLLMEKLKLISEEFHKVKQFNSQPASFFGLAKVDKKKDPLWPMVTTPRSTYHALAAGLGNYLKKLPEANKNTNVKKSSGIAEGLEP